MSKKSIKIPDLGLSATWHSILLHVLVSNDCTVSVYAPVRTHAKLSTLWFENFLLNQIRCIKSNRECA